MITGHIASMRHLLIQGLHKATTALGVTGHHATKLQEIRASYSTTVPEADENSCEQTKTDDNLASVANLPNDDAQMRADPEPSKEEPCYQPLGTVLAAAAALNPKLHPLMIEPELLPVPEPEPGYEPTPKPILEEDPFEVMDLESVSFEEMENWAYSERNTGKVYTHVPIMRPGVVGV